MTFKPEVTLCWVCWYLSSREVRGGSGRGQRAGDVGGDEAGEIVGGGLAYSLGGGERMEEKQK